ncbi:MAG TPA: tetratricopeptide repeat protein, partial [Pyrinomonadaceae bacterium]
MSVQDLPSDLETRPEPDAKVVRRLVRALDYSKGFWLGFAKSNTHAQRRRLAALCRDLLEPLKIRVLEIELTEPVTDLLPVLRERLAREHAANDEDTKTGGALPTSGEASAAARWPKLAIFVHGLEHSIPSREAYPPLLSSLNLKRELFRQEAPHPLLLWLPDYALTALARQAPDFWAWRSGLYEFAPERETAEQSLEVVRGEAIHVTKSLSQQAKHERLVMLKGLLDDYRELGNGLRERSASMDILNEIGLLHEALGEWAEAEQAYGDSLIISRSLNDAAGEAIALHNMGGIAQNRGEVEEARRLYSESLEICKRLGNQRGIADTLHELGRLAQSQGEAGEARRLYSESLEIGRRLGYQSDVAQSMNQLATLTADEGNIEEASRLFNECLQIDKRLNNQSGVAITLHNLGRLAQ